MPIITNTTLSSTVDLIRRDKSVVERPLSHAAFTLDSSGVAGFFGGESAVRAMATVNFLPQRRWCGWYNAPGSYEIARQYSPLAMSDIFDGLFPGGERDPAKILMVDGQVGPAYIPLHSQSSDLSRIGHFGYLLSRKVRQVPIMRDLELGGRRTINPRVTLVTLDYTMLDTFEKLNSKPEKMEQMNPKLDGSAQQKSMLDKSKLLSLIPSFPTTFALGTILISVGGCVSCVLIADWFSFASIALGIIANGIACSIFGSGELILKHSIPADPERPGDIVLKSSTEIVVLIGNEGAVSPFTHARFILRYHGKAVVGQEQENREDDANAPDNGAAVGLMCRRCKGSILECKGCSLWSKIQQKHLVRASVTLLLFQFLSQLLLIPQGTLFGQLMFITTLVPSWIYHSYLSSLSLNFQTNTLLERLRLTDKNIRPYQLNTWTEAVVFACLALASHRHKSFYGSGPSESKRKIEGLLDGLLPSKTDVWKTWKTWLAEGIVKYADCENQGKVFPPKFPSRDENNRTGDEGRESGDQKALRRYTADANSALKAWKTVQSRTHRDSKP